MPSVHRLGGRQIVPNSRTGSSKASVSEAVVCTWHHAYVVKGRPEGPSAGKHLTAQCTHIQCSCMLIVAMFYKFK